MMALAEKQTVIRLIGSPSERDQAKLDIDDTLTEADEIVYEVTRKEDWTSDEYGYRLAVHAANKYAAAQLLNEWHDPAKKAPQYQKDYEDNIAKLKNLGYGGSKDSGNPSFQVAIGHHKENVKLTGPFISEEFFGADYFDWSEYYR